MNMQDWMELAVGLLISGLIGSAIGRIRGRAPAGFVLGLLLGPLGWILVLAGPDRRPKCPECKGAVEKDARRCKHCGESLVFDAAAYEREKAARQGPRNPEE